MILLFQRCSAGTIYIDQRKQNRSLSPVILKVGVFFHKEEEKCLQIHGEIASVRCFQRVAMQKSEPGWVRPCACQAHRSSR